MIEYPKRIEEFDRQVIPNEKIDQTLNKSIEKN